MQHHTLAVEGEHDHRFVGGRLARRRTQRFVESVEALGHANRQLLCLTAWAPGRRYGGSGSR